MNTFSESSPLKRLYGPEAYGPEPVTSWWEASAPPLSFETPQLAGETQADIAIIGGGYTGMSAAIELAEAHGAKVVVLDAARPGWGASGRNGGFCCFGGTRLDPAGLIARHGLEATREVVGAQVRSIDFVASRIEALGLDVDRHGEGEVLFVHREKFIDEVREEASLYRDKLGIAAAYWDNDRCREAGLPGDLWHGGFFLPHGFGLHPLKYLRGLAEAAIRLGVVIHGGSEVHAVDETSDGVVLTTPGGTVRARAAIVATNGYLSENLPGWFGGRFMPVLSNILVTRPLTDDERAAHGWTGDMICADTRALLHYFRMLPDGRMMFGGRGGTATDPASVAKMRDTLRRAFDRMFPNWANVETTHFWNGLLCMPSDMKAFCGQVPGSARVFASMGYCGSGVAMSSLLGTATAQMAIQATTANEPGRIAVPDSIPSVFRKPPARFPFAAFRNLGLKLAYGVFTLRDEYL
ncbi:NAD(P)/FAD-dependent oxidoreductase [Tepidamorphus sp. 3E244]|uniref:NAD(P)/FAD-dependent oxidoreductase n=1 Tax=Tepidamorphus sp. 3E244 TaxID=3385498 RepID=UPI0038FC54A8